MVRPTRVQIPTEPAFNLVRSVLEELTEPFVEIFGKYEGDTVYILNTFNLATADKGYEEVSYGNMSAKARLDAFEEVLERLSASSERGVIAETKRLGQAHSHPYPRILSPSRGDYEFIRDRMDEYGLDCWLEIIIGTRIVEPEFFGIRYARRNRRPVLELSHNNKKVNKLDGFGMSLVYSAHYIYRSNGRLRRRELPVYFDRNLLKYCVTA